MEQLRLLAVPRIRRPGRLSRPAARRAEPELRIYQWVRSETDQPDAAVYGKGAAQHRSGAHLRVPAVAPGAASGGKYSSVAEVVWFKAQVRSHKKYVVT